MAASVTRAWRGVVGWTRSLDTSRLKQIGVVTYFGVYALLHLDVHTVLNEAMQSVPAGVRPQPIQPVWVVIDLPKSVAMGTFSLGVTVLVLLLVVGKSAATAIRGRGQGQEATPAEDAGQSDVGSEATENERIIFRGGQSPDPDTADQVTADSATTDRPTADRPTADQVTADRPTADQVTADRPTADQVTADRPTADRPTADQVTADQVTDDRPTADRPTANQVPSDRAAADQVTDDESATGPTEAGRTDDDPWPEGWMSGKEL